MVCVGRKAQVLALRGMDIRRGNHPSNRRAFSAMLTSVAYTSPNPGRRSVWTSSSQLRSFTWCRLFSTPQWLRNTRSSSLGPHRRELRLLSRYQCSRLTSPVPMSTLSFSTIAACLAPGNPNSSRIYSASASSVQMRRFSITPAFFRQSPPSGSPSSSRANPSAIASSTSGWFPLIRTGSPVRG